MLNEFAQFAQTLADEAASMLLAHHGGAIATQIKTDKTWVTALDVAIEKRLRDMIFATYPTHGILGEEFDTINADAEWVWVIDPIDGTMAYLAGMAVYSTLIALAHYDKPVIGIMHFPATQERWLGIAGQTTLFNGKPCHTRTSDQSANTTCDDDLSGCIQSSSSPDFFTPGFEQDVLQSFKSHTAWRVYGGAAMSYGRLASGRTDIALDAGLKVYDYAPFIPIIEGAGGVISDWEGQSLTLLSGSQVLAAGDPKRHAAALQRIQEVKK